MPRMDVARPEASPGLIAEGMVGEPRLRRLVVGLDPPEGTPLDEGALARLRDPLAVLVFQRGLYPVTLRELLHALGSATGPRAVPVQRTFLTGEGSQIPWTAATREVERQLRCTVTRGPDRERTDLLVTTSPDADSPTAFLQVLAWDADRRVFNYYLRVEGTGTWTWAGDSDHALTPATRGRGPFQAHVNGVPVMRELREPWNNWHSSRAGVHDAIPPKDPLRTDPLWRRPQDADVFEKVTKRCVERWTEARLQRIVERGRIEHPARLLRHLFETTTVNLRTTDTEYAALEDSTELALPLTFLFNLEALEPLCQDLPARAPLIPGSHYRSALSHHRSRLADDRGWERLGDTHFAFLFPEPALEDNAVVRLAVRAGLLTERFAGCALMVDFPNPVYSPRRAALLHHAPEAATVDGHGSNLPECTAQRIVEAAAEQGPESPEEEFAALWRLGEPGWRAAAAARLQSYVDAVSRALSDEVGVDSLVRLAESRRRLFATSALNEFPLLLPRTDLPEDMPVLAMRPDGTVALQEDAAPHLEEAR